MMNRSFRISFLMLTGLFLFISISCSHGPAPRADSAFRKYEGMPGVYTFRIPPSLLNLFVTEETTDDVVDFLSSMKTIKVILVNKTEIRDKEMKHFLEDFKKILDEDHFEDLLVMTDAGDQVWVKIHEDGEMIDEAMVMISGTDEFLGLSLVGNIDPETLGAVVRELQIEDMVLPQ